ncbi:MAG: helix-turn-helix transcriptional regulator [Peptostreptococcaceae bacterium]
MIDIARLENAKYNPSLELAVRISKELNTPIEELFIY